MRIGFDVTALSAPASGVGTYTASLLEHLRGNGDEILPLTHRASDGKRRLNKTLWMQTLLPLALRGQHVDVCHFTNNVAPVWTPCPSVLTIHDMTLWLFPEYHYRRRLIAMRPVIPHAARQAAAIITMSQTTKADIVRILGISPAKIHVVYEAPNAAFRPISPGPSLDEVRHRYNLPEHFILYVGTIEPRKNLVRLLEAFAALDLPHGLVFAGPRGWKDEQVFETVERLGLRESARFLGYVPLDTLAALYNLADVLAFPSLYEGFGLPVIEAMACGTPVVTSDRGALREIAGGVAECVEPTEVESIAAGLRHVLTDASRHAELRVQGLARAANFSWAATADQTRQIYARVMGR